MMPLLNIITNIIISNLGNVDTLGLRYGKIGICMYLYRYAMYTRQEYYSRIADSLIDEVYMCGRDNVPTDIYNGMAGIGVGLCHLLSEGFATGHAENVLSGIDRLMFENMNRVFMNDVQSFRPLFSSGIYLLHRIPLCDNCRLPDKMAGFMNSCESLVAEYMKKNVRRSMVDSLFMVFDNLKQYGNDLLRPSKQLMDQVQWLKEHIHQDFYDKSDCILDWWTFLCHRRPMAINDGQLQQLVSLKIEQYPYNMDTIFGDLSVLGLILLNKRQ